MKFKNFGIFMLCVAMLVSTSASVRAWAESVIDYEEEYVYYVDGVEVAGAIFKTSFTYSEPDYVYADSPVAEDEWGIDGFYAGALDLYEGGQPNQFAYAGARMATYLGDICVDYVDIEVHCDVYGNLY